VPLSVGVATGTQTGPHELVREADLELYRAKAASSGALRDAQTAAEPSPRALLSDR
jgi:GGDEF domain-containing protein